jgi:hypothetical protein
VNGWSECEYGGFPAEFGLMDNGHSSINPFLIQYALKAILNKPKKGPHHTPVSDFAILDQLFSY